MYKTTFLLIAVLLVAGGFVKQSPNDISKSLELFVFPAEDQDADTQEMDEYKCFKWAKEQTGYDPLNPPDIQPEQPQQQEASSGRTPRPAARSAARGAAAGAAVGAIAGDAGEGAAIGATVGAFSGVRQKAAQGQQKEAAAQQQQAAAEQSVADQQAALLDGFKKAFSACMEAKGYTVK